MEVAYKQCTERQYPVLEVDMVPILVPTRLKAHTLLDMVWGRMAVASFFTAVLDLQQPESDWRRRRPNRVRFVVFWYSSILAFWYSDIMPAVMVLVCVIVTTAFFLV